MFHALSPFFSSFRLAIEMTVTSSLVLISLCFGTCFGVTIGEGAVLVFMRILWLCVQRLSCWQSSLCLFCKSQVYREPTTARSLGDDMLLKVLLLILLPVYGRRPSRSTAPKASGEVQIPFHAHVKSGNQLRTTCGGMMRLRVAKSEHAGRMLFQMPLSHAINLWGWARADSELHGAVHFQASVSRRLGSRRRLAHWQTELLPHLVLEVEELPEPPLDSPKLLPGASGTFAYRSCLCMPGAQESQPRRSASTWAVQSLKDLKVQQQRLHLMSLPCQCPNNHRRSNENIWN